MNRLLTVLLLLGAGILGIGNGTDAVIGGADGPAEMYIDGGDEERTARIEFESNPTTGFEWSAETLRGSSVSLEKDEYISDETEEPVCGSGGTQVYVFRAEEPGETLVRFTYARSWEEEPAEVLLYLFTVQEELRLSYADVTESSRYPGTVREILESEHAVTLDCGERGEVTAVFPEDMDLPEAGAEILVYTDGIISLSEPPVVSCMEWMETGS